MKYTAQERAWVMRLLARLTPEQRQRYEAACRVAPRHHRSGKLYDGARAAIAERILIVCGVTRNGLWRIRRDGVRTTETWLPDFWKWDQAGPA